jgi:hypothetical protein
MTGPLLKKTKLAQSLEIFPLGIRAIRNEVHQWD